MTRDELLDLFRRSGALLEGHFRLTSGLHSPGYLQCALVLQHPQQAEALGRAIADRVRDLRPTVVLSPALGGVVIGQEVGRALGVRAIFGERQDGRLALRRGFTLDAADRVLVVEDVMTTGGSTRETIEVAKAAGGQVVGTASIVNRGGAAIRFDVPYVSLLEIALPTYEPDAVPALRAGPAGGEAGITTVTLHAGTASGRSCNPAMTTFKITAGLRRHRLRRLAASGQRRLDPGADRGRAARARRSRRDGDRRGPHRRRRPRARPGRRVHPRARARARRRRPRAQRQSAARDPGDRRRRCAARVSSALRRAHEDLSIPTVERTR